MRLAAPTPFDVAAVGRGIEVGLEDLALGVAGLQLQRARHLHELAARMRVSRRQRRRAYCMVMVEPPMRAAPL
jgi:hypothetical protein